MKELDSLLIGFFVLVIFFVFYLFDHVIIASILLHVHHIISYRNAAAQ